MSASTLLFSIWPAFLDESLADTNPFIFNAHLLLGKVLAVVLFLSIFHPNLLQWTHQVDDTKGRPFLQLTWRLCKTRIMFWCIIANAAHILFAYSVRYIDTTVATIFHEASPILHMWLIYKLSQPGKQSKGSSERRSARYRKVGIVTIALWLIALIGMVLVVAGSGSADDETSRSVALSTLGVVLAAVSGVAGALNAVHLRWGADLRRKFNAWQARALEDAPHPDGHQGPPIAEQDAVELACIMTCYGIAALVMTPVSLAFGIATRGALIGDHFFVTVGAGAAIFFSGHLLARWAFMRTHDLAINAVGYATPLLALLWLSLFTSIDKITDPDLVVLGAGAILAANILLQVQPELETSKRRRIGFPSLVIGLWMCGAAVHFRDKIYRALNIDFAGFPAEQYWSLVATVTTLFALTLSFRVSRLVERIGREEALMICLLRHLEHLGHRSLPVSSLMNILSEIDIETDHEELRSQYDRARKELELMRSKCKDDQGIQNDLSTVEIELDQLVHGRRYGYEFAEYIAIWILGMLIAVLLTLVNAPNLLGFPRFVIEFSSTVFGAVIIFLVANLSDLRIQRSSKVMRVAASGTQYGSLSLPKAEVLGTERTIAVVIAIGLMVTFGVLFWP